MPASRLAASKATATLATPFSQITRNTDLFSFDMCCFPRFISIYFGYHERLGNPPLPENARILVFAASAPSMRDPGR
jgi:hypothetical protein